MSATVSSAQVVDIDAAVREIGDYVHSMAGEINDMRADIEMMKRGGWTVSVGPFVELPQSSMASAPVPETHTLTNSAFNTPANGDDVAQEEESHQSTGCRVDTRGDAQERPIAPLRTTRGGANSAVKTIESAQQAESSVSNHPKQSETSDESEHAPIRTVEEPFSQQLLRPPLAVRNMRPLPQETLANVPPMTTMRSFSLDFLTETLRGKRHSPGFFYVPKTVVKSMLDSRSYYAFDAVHEPYLPARPGEHGAKLTAFFNADPSEVYGDDVEAYTNVPLFICNTPYTKEKRRYVYFGHYSQTRWSDKLDYDRMVEDVPSSVKMYWAEMLSQIGRPDWVTQQLMQHFYPKPQYDGIMPTEDAEEEEEEERRLQKDVKRYIRDLASWRKEAELKTKLLKKETILKAFESADAGDPAGLRLWWEYLECIGWDEGFYQMLVKHSEGKC